MIDDELKELTERAFCATFGDERAKSNDIGKAFASAILATEDKNHTGAVAALQKSAMEKLALAWGCHDIHTIPNDIFQKLLTSIEQDIVEYSNEARREKAATTMSAKIKAMQDIVAHVADWNAPDPGDIDLERPKILEHFEQVRDKINELLTDPNIDDDTGFEPSITDMIQVASKQTDGFEPATLKAAWVSFPDASMSFIGAPTSRGKTAMMSSIAIDALKDTDRNVLFMSLEETAEQILRRLVFALAYRTASKAERKTLKNGITYDGIAKPRKAWKAFAKMIHDPKDEQAQLQDPGTFQLLKAALDEVTVWRNNDRLAICDCEGRHSGKIFARASQVTQGDLVMYDYIQRLPSGIQSLTTDMRFAVQGINDELLGIAKRRKAIVIAGAQFNRTGGKVKSKDKDTQSYQNPGDDILDDTLFAETAGIERDAHIAIGIGGNANDNKRHFLKVLKNREGEKDAVYNLDFCGAFSYVKATTRMDTSTQAGSGGEGGNDDTTTEQGEGKKDKYQDDDNAGIINGRPLFRKASK